MIRGSFTVPVFTGKLERNLPKLKRFKINSRCYLGVKHLQSILRTMEDGSSWKTFDPISPIKKWCIDKFRRKTEEKGPHNYKLRNPGEVNVKSLSNDGS